MTPPDQVHRAEIDALLDQRGLLPLEELATVLRRKVENIRLARWRGTLGIETVQVGRRYFVRSADVRKLIDPPKGTDR